MDNMGSKPVQKVNPVEMKKVDNPIAVSNRFDALLDDSGDEPVKNNEVVDKSEALVTQCTEETNGVGNNVVKLNDVDLKHAGLGSQSGSTKVKLAKELRSLGPLETGYKKKRRDGRREATLNLKELVREQDVCFIGLLETKMTCIGRREVDYLIGNDWDFYHIPAVGFSGGMLVLWDKKIVTFVVKVTSSHIVTVYGSRCCKEREDLWRKLEEGLKEHNPSIIGGDFNCILNKDEKRGGKRFVFSKGPREMKQFMTNSDFHDVRSIGPRHLARVASDHSQIAFKLDEKIQFKRMNIKFEDTWRSYPAARSIVYHSWKKNDFGDHSEILQRKTSRTMKALFFWSKSKCKNLKTLKEELKKDIIELQNKEAVGIDWTNEDLLLLRSKVHELNVTLNRLATWWNQRAKARWHEEGDNNSKMFHNFASARRNGNRVVQIRDVNNISQVEDDEIEKKLSQGVVTELCSEFTLAELQASVFQQGNNRAPVGYPIKKKVIRLFGYKNVKEMSYLEIKLSLNRLKLADFQDMLSNVMDKLNTWGKKTLSLGDLPLDGGSERAAENVFGNTNCVKHGKSALPSSMIASNALALPSNKDSPYLSNWGTNLLRESCESWCPPLKDLMKINVDAALLRSNCAGVGGIFRDHKGRFILAFGEKKIHWDITKLEMEAVYSAFEASTTEQYDVQFWKWIEKAKLNPREEEDNSSRRSCNVTEDIEYVARKCDKMKESDDLDDIKLLELIIHDDHKVVLNDQLFFYYPDRKLGLVKVDYPTLKAHPSKEKGEEKPMFRKNKKRALTKDLSRASGWIERALMGPCYKKDVKLHHVATENQLANIFTKPLAFDTFSILRTKLGEIDINA
ncbi:hypothetical protein KFK09_028320 [Dendrobium nobile]|uniref:Uncharacterized protein n=1 Tax=Dendrobium nobile TaxID=94219 RepID=A0A8T3A2T7_DENNO|nr:hypothetical protein KFK09_028320 [Dendrobium nobile]